MKKPTYPQLAKLMAKHGISKTELASIANLSYRQCLKKLNYGGEATFNVIEVKSIISRIRELEEKLPEEYRERDLSVDSIFFAPEVTNVSRTA